MQVSRVAPDVLTQSLRRRRRAMDERITYIGLDVHKETIAVALAEGSGRGQVCEHGQIYALLRNPIYIGKCQRQSKSEPKGSAKCCHFGSGVMSGYACASIRAAALVI
jgi:hypothetical protein